MDYIENLQFEQLSLPFGEESPKQEYLLIPSSLQGFHNTDTTSHFLPSGRKSFCMNGTLDQIDLKFSDNAAVCVVLASGGYPSSYEKGKVITGLENFDGRDDLFCFHAGTKFNENNETVTSGGRVLGVTALAGTLKEARAKAYEAVKLVSFDKAYYRHDIGKAIDQA